MRVNIDYHVEVGGHYYSVPYALVKYQLAARLTTHTVELFHKGKRIASHRRSPHKGRHTPVTAHLPKAHHYDQWTPQRLIRWAEKTGGAAAQAVRPHPSLTAASPAGFRACLGLMRLGKHYGDHRLEAACHRAMVIGSCSYRSIDSILKYDLDRQPLPGTSETTRSDYGGTQ